MDFKFQIYLPFYLQQINRKSCWIIIRNEQNPLKIYSSILTRVDIIRSVIWE